MTKLTVINNVISEQPTMTSLEMVDYINADRKAKAKAEGLKFPCKEYKSFHIKTLWQKRQGF
ncbi:hypothetical protein K7H99_02570 [Providencia rettgeri]|nr:hypothetical protein K7H99_02570 [Providencia rettgeri]